MLTCNGKPLICTYSDDGTVLANPDIAGIGVSTHSREELRLLISAADPYSLHLDFHTDPSGHHLRVLAWSNPPRKIQSPR
jgi:hypothetical protein